MRTSRNAKSYRWVGHAQILWRKLSQMVYTQAAKFVNISPSKVPRYTVYIMIQYHAAHTEVQLLVDQILMNFAVCDESRPFLLDHGGLVDVMVEAVGMNQLREAVRTSALKALLELGRADNRVILNRVSG